MRDLTTRATSLLRHTQTELRLFWRMREAVYLHFVVPMLGMALFVYLSREGLLQRVFGLLIRGLETGGAALGESSPMALVTVGLITYCVIAVAFEGQVPRTVSQRDEGVLKRLRGTPLRPWVLLAGTALSASVLVLVEVGLILIVGLVSADFTIVGSPWVLTALLLLGTFTMTALGTIIGSVIRSPDGAVAAVHAIYIPMLLLCGAFVPLEALPRGLEVLAKVFPLTYFAGPFRAVLVEGAGLATIGTDLVILLLWTAASWIVAIATFKWE